MRHSIDGLPRLIQAGMGVHVSSAKLANLTSRLGAFGVVSGTGLREIVTEEVRSGDADAIRTALTFPIRHYVDELLQYAPGGARHRLSIPMDVPDPVRGALPKRLSTICAFIEVRRAKQGHRGKVGINVMWKCALTVLPTIYGAMLAGVDGLLCGAGVPMELPDIVQSVQAGRDMEYLPLTGTGTYVRLQIAQDDPASLLTTLEPPRLMPILSNYAFPRRVMEVWAREYDGVRPDAFVLENHAAGGHNAPPRDKERFGPRDDIEAYFDKCVELGVPIYVAGTFPEGGTREDLLHWCGRGAYGIQVGSRFALSNESGLRRDLKDRVIAANIAGTTHVHTNQVLSPTGYPFKVADLPGTMADPAVYAQRRRLCNRGYLLQSNLVVGADGSTRETYVCPAMPPAQYARRGGQAADLDGRHCLCNSLLAAAGLHTDEESPLVTLGLSGSSVRARVPAREIVEDILTPDYVAEMEQRLALEAAPDLALRLALA